MADSPLPNIPYRAPLVDESGTLSLEWSAFFRGLYLRVGQANALTNIELEALAGGSTVEGRITALTDAVATNQLANLSLFNDLAQGRTL